MIDLTTRPTATRASRLAALLVLLLPGCNHLITGEPLIYGVDPISGEIIDRDVVVNSEHPQLGVIPHTGEIITLVVNSVFIKHLADVGSPHVLVYAQVFDDGSDDPARAITKVLFNETDQPSGVNLGLADRVLYGPTSFKGFPIRVRFFIVELDKAEKETASRIIDTAGAIATSAKPDAGPAIAVGVQIAKALNELNSDDYELRFDLTLYPLGAVASSTVADDEIDGLPDFVSLHRQGKPVSPAMPLQMGSYVIIKREIDGRTGVAQADPSSVLEYDWAQRMHVQRYQGRDGNDVLSREIIRFQGGYLYRIVRDILIPGASAGPASPPVSEPPQGETGPAQEGEGEAVLPAEDEGSADEEASEAEIAAETTEVEAGEPVEEDDDASADSPSEGPDPRRPNSAPVKLRFGPNKNAEFVLQKGLRQRFRDQTYVTLSVIQGLPLGVDEATLRAASDRDLAQLTEVLDDPGQVPLERIGERVDELADIVKESLELRRLSELASRRAGRDPTFRSSPQYPLFWVQRLRDVPQELDSSEGRAAIQRNRAVLTVIVDLVLNLPPLDPSDAADMAWLNTLAVEDLEADHNANGLFRVTDAAIARRSGDGGTPSGGTE